MRIALCQIQVGDDPKENLAAARAAIASVAGTADLAVFPEATQVRFGNDLAAVAEPLDGPFVTGLREAAREHGVAVVAGVFEPAPQGRVFNSAVAVDGSGELVGVYRKMHLFDAFSFTESEVVAPGPEPVVVTLGGLRIGLATCYDVRFPELFRALADQGAEAFVLVAAWAQGVAKEDHWTTLVRARAIENTMWTVAVDKAPDTTSPPRGGRTGVGRSLLVDPMGTATLDLGTFPEVRTGTLDPAVTDRVRETLPSLRHRHPNLR